MIVELYLSLKAALLWHDKLIWIQQFNSLINNSVPFKIKTAKLKIYTYYKHNRIIASEASNVKECDIFYSLVL